MDFKKFIILYYICIVFDIVICMVYFFVNKLYFWYFWYLLGKINKLNVFL